MISDSRSLLDKIIQEGVNRMLQEALKNEVEECLGRLEHQRMEDGRWAIVWYGYLPDRDMVTGAGPVRIPQERIRDRSGRSKFTSRILPSYMRIGVFLINYPILPPFESNCRQPVSILPVEHQRKLTFSRPDLPFRAGFQRVFPGRRSPICDIGSFLGALRPRGSGDACPQGVAEH